MRVFGRKWALPAGVTIMVVTFACGSSSLTSIKAHGNQVRWVVLIAVLLGALAVSVQRYRVGRRLPLPGLVRAAALPAAFLALALLSTAWSVSPRLTFERAVSLGLLFALGAALVYCTQGDADARRRVFVGLALGATAVGALGIMTLIVSYDNAVQPGTPQTPWRFRGFTENPNTISVLAAVALPIVAWLGISCRGGRERAFWLASGLLLLGSTIAALSRGGILASDLGLAVVVLAAVRPRRSAAACLVGIALVTTGGIGFRQLETPPPPAFVSAVAPAPTPAALEPKPHKGGSQSRPGSSGRSGPELGRQGQSELPSTPLDKLIPLPITTQGLPRAIDEIGNPLLSKENTSTVGSGRIAAWGGALRTAESRPLLGYGFGTEQKVFVDRWYYFNGGLPENSFIGIVLQLGLVGVAVISGFGLLLLYRSLRLYGSTRDADRGVIAAGLGVLVAAVGVMLIQSYLYSVGNVATATVWITLFMLGAVVLEPRVEREGARHDAHSGKPRPLVRGGQMRHRVLLAAAGTVLVAALLVGVGRWERRHAVDEQVAGFRVVLAAVGGRLDERTLSGFRYGPPDCLSYHDTIQRFAYQLCFDPQGRLVEAVDRRGTQPKYYSLEYEPPLSPLRFPRAQVDQLLRSAEASR